MGGETDHYLSNICPSKSGGFEFGISTNYDNVVKSGLIYRSAGWVDGAMKSGKRCQRDQHFPDGCGYFHRPVTTIQAPKLASAGRSQEGKPWRVKVSMVISGGRMWFVVDGVLYDPHVCAVMDS